MNSLQRVRAVLAGQIPDRVPVCLHNFLLAAREAGIPMATYRTDPRAIARAHLNAVKKYGYDCILIDLDTTMLAEGLGAKSECAGNESGRIVAPAIQSLEEVGRLKVVNPETDGRIPALLESVRLIAEEVGEEIAIRGNADQAAFSLACSVRGIEAFLIDLASDPENPSIQELLEICYRSHITTHRALIRAGAHFTSCGDSLAGPAVVSPRMFDRFARPWEEKLVNELAAEGVFTVIHICGDTTRILSSLREYNSCGFELDYETDARMTKSTVGTNHVLLGNIDPSGVIARGTAEEVRAATRELMAIWKPAGRFILNAGCAIPASTPEENLRAFIATAHQEGQYMGESA